MRFLSPLFSILLALLTPAAPVMAQIPAQGATSDPALPSLVQLRVLADEKKPVLAGSRSADGITVEVSDAAGVRVANAAVVFHFPDSGPSATFADGSLTALAYTDSNGRAQMPGIHWGNIPGLVNIRITAAKATTHAGLLFQQTVSAATASQNASASQAADLRSPAPVAEQAASVQRPPAPGVIAEAKRAPAVTVEHRGPHSRDADVNAAPAQAQPSPAGSALADDDSPDANVPMRHMLRTGADEAEVPRVSISSAGPASSGGHSKTKWIIALGVAAAAGTAFAMVHKGGSSSGSASSVTIGSPTVSVGHP